MKKIEEKEIMKVLWDYHQELTSTDEDVRDGSMQKAIDRFLAIIAQDRKELREKLEHVFRDIKSFNPDGEIATLCGQGVALLTPNEE